MSEKLPSAEFIGYDNYGQHLDDDILDFNIYNQSIYNDNDSMKMSSHLPRVTPYYFPDNTAPGSPFSGKSLQRSFSTRSKNSTGSQYTRQINMSIAEEWENQQAHWTEKKASTFPSTPKIYTAQPLHPWSEHPEKQTAEDSLDYFFQRLSEEGRVSPRDFTIQPNPYNDCNHKIHAALHCPCFFFFCLLCCFPGVHYMQKSDEEYKMGHEHRSKVDSRISTIMYILGIFAAVIFLSGLIYFSVTIVNGQSADERLK